MTASPDLGVMGGGVYHYWPLPPPAQGRDPVAGQSHVVDGPAGEGPLAESHHPDDQGEGGPHRHPHISPRPLR